MGQVRKIRQFRIETQFLEQPIARKETRVGGGGGSLRDEEWEERGLDTERQDFKEATKVA
jgi:hypothetical protein